MGLVLLCLGAVVAVSCFINFVRVPRIGTPMSLHISAPLYLAMVMLHMLD